MFNSDPAPEAKKVSILSQKTSSSSSATFCVPQDWANLKGPSEFMFCRSSELETHWPEIFTSKLTPEVGVMDVCSDSRSQDGQRQVQHTPNYRGKNPPTPRRGPASWTRAFIKRKAHQSSFKIHRRQNGQGVKSDCICSEHSSHTALPHQ